MASNEPGPAEPIATAAPLSRSGRYLVLVVASLGWLCAGMFMSITGLTGQAAAIDLLRRTGELNGSRFEALSRQAQVKGPAKASGVALSALDQAELQQGKAVVARWFAWFQCAFLFGAAAGGLCFGRLGDRIGRAKAMAASILTYSGMAAAASAA